MGRLFQIALRNLLEHRRRSLLLGGAIALVVILLVLMRGLSGGIQETILRSATTLSTGHVNVGGFYKVTPGVARPAVTDYREVERVVRAAVPDLSLMVQRVRGGFDRVISDESSLQNAIIGLDVAAEANLAGVLDVVAGDLGDLAEPGTALIFERQAADLNVTVGDALIVAGRTARGVRNTVDVRVVAIAEDMGILSAFTTYLDHQTVRRLYQLRETTTGAFLLYLSDRTASDDVAATLRTALEEAGYEVMPPEAKPTWQKQRPVEREEWTGQRLDVSTWSDEVANLTPIIEGLDLLGGLLVAVLMGIILAGIMNALWVAIRQRTQEIGTLRAIGMSPGRVRAMIVLEAAMLSLIGSVAGALLGVGLTALLNEAELVVPNEAAQIFLMNDTLILDIDVGGLVTALALIVAVTAVFALIPAHRAARIPPVAAMQSAN